ncbi:3'(2'),5'-bisphosphate nucleotidase CysQ [Methylocystis bryophila]|uniref:3'(2'),5'-bisphosphate nucleotidase CysQ n=2 Tax=Methylocystis bryophila TaxID=655015 RepID=A0A1W6N0W5_9HYPH|nr:3'(2'),5'-bisphosphate nucleotidase CysQ [Methylocystis bryophila]ARN83457.1 3'(2'),5'-bisphosphate nucleotidase CysQ [Methylocystis bryophila]
MQGFPADLRKLASRLEQLAREAGAIALTDFRLGERTSAEIRLKGGGSPVTDADIAVDRFLQQGAKAILPEAGWLSEESADNPERLERDWLFIVDPIDGTTAFLRGDPRWCVSLALIDKGRPVVGVVHAPALDHTFLALRGGGAFLNEEAIGVSARADLQGAAFVAPTEYQDVLGDSLYELHFVKRNPSLALRIAQIAMGDADVAIAKPNARDWDIAAADVILSEAGGALVELDGDALTYNRPNPRRDMLVAAPKALLGESLALAKAAARRGS